MEPAEKTPGNDYANIQARNIASLRNQIKPNSQDSSSVNDAQQTLSTFNSSAWY